MIRSMSYAKLKGIFVYVGLPLLVILNIWLPVINHYHVDDALITEDLIASSRNFPSDSILDEINRFKFGINIAPKDENETVLIAEKILYGNLDTPGYPRMKFDVSFNPADLDSQNAAWRLYYTSFALQDVLIDAYKISNRDEFLKAVVIFFRNWASYELNAWLPKGLLWNDHVISNRIRVILKFWRYYRKHPEYDSQTAEIIFRLIAKSRQFLARPSHYNFRSNHGIIQNLALWHICVSVPHLPRKEYYKKLAFERMKGHLSYYISSEGVVLEHSAGYHKLGLKLLSMSFRYLTLLDISIPSDWSEKYARMKNFYALLRRPDGSLPLFGDTHERKDELGPPVAYPDQYGKTKKLKIKDKWLLGESNNLFPVSGYAIWWSGLENRTTDKSSQTVVLWSYFPKHAHKHADEMSVVLWAYGQKWWSATGYWPYGNKERKKAISWRGSNAPHLADESKKSDRWTELKFYGWSKHIAAVDLERKGPETYKVRRQIIFLKPSLWVVIDHHKGNKFQIANTLWTTGNKIHLQKEGIPGAFILKGDDRAILKKYIIGSEGIKLSNYKGSIKPFAGWEDKKPAECILVEQPAGNSWTAVVWSLENAEPPYRKVVKPPVMAKWDNSDNWRLEIFYSNGLIAIHRAENHVVVNGFLKDPNTAAVNLKPDRWKQKGANRIKENLKFSSQKYPSFKNYSMARYYLATLYTLIILFVQLPLFYISTRSLKKYSNTIHFFVACLWIGFLGWVNFYYF